MTKPRISVIIITYNQENVISRTLDSVIEQGEYVYEICVSDDCSKDRTWDILNEYSIKYPGLFVLNRNTPNVGIFENNEKVWTMPHGDFVYGMAGDDAVPTGWFKKVSEFVCENNLDYQNGNYCIMGNFKCVYPNGDTYTNKNNKNIQSGFDPIRLYERGLVSPRSSVFSINVLRKFEKVSRGRSFISENAQDCQLFIHSKNFYYINAVGNIYYSGIGVSSNMTEERKKQHEQTMVYAFEFLRHKNIFLDPKDKFLPAHNVAQKRMIWNPSLSNFIVLLKYKYKIFDRRLAFRSDELKRKLFALLRRFPHRKPILW